MRRLAISALVVAAVALAAVAAKTRAADEADVNLTGAWSCDDDGTYYLRQIGKHVWWVGMSADNGKSWTNTFKGVIKGDNVIGDWADVPRGESLASGSMTLACRLVDGKVVELSRTRLVGDGFGGTNWKRKN